MAQDTHARTRGDSRTGFCGRTDCARPLRARGLCNLHYKQEHSKYRTHERVCVICGSAWRTQRATAKYCSDSCKAFGYLANTTCDVPDRHASRSTPVPTDHPSRVQSSTLVRPLACACAWCGTEYIPTSGNYSYCTRTCGRRHKVARRRGRERGWSACYTWTEVITVLLRFDHCCAYCGEWVDQPEPDHVVPLSRGGSNGIGNILPSCRADNSDKRDLLLSEWNADRARRGLAPRIASWDADDPRVAHLSMRSRYSAPSHAA